MTKAQIQKIKDQLKKKWQAGEITASEYFDTIDLFDLDDDKAAFEASLLLGNAAVYEPPKKETQPAPGGMTQEEYEAAKKQKYQDYKAGKITNYAYIQWKKQNNPAVQPAGGAVSAPAAKAVQTPVQKTAAQNAPKTAGMTQEEYNKAKSEMYQKYKNGEITNYAYIQWKKQNNPAVQPQAAQAPASPAAKAQTPAQKKTAPVAPKTAGNGIKIGSPEHLELGKALMEKSKSGLITSKEYNKISGQITKLIKAGASFEEIQAQTGLYVKPAATGWSAADHNAIYDTLYEKKENGVITDSELSKFVDQLNNLENSGMTAMDAQKIMNDAVEFVWKNGMTPEEAVSSAKNAPAPTASGKSIDEQYEEIADLAGSAPNTYGFMDYEDANALMEMVDDLKSQGVAPSDAKSILEAAIDQMDINGMGVEEAIQEAKKAVKTAPAMQATTGDQMTPAKYNEYIDMVVDLYKQGDCTEEQQNAMLDELQKLYEGHISEHDVMSILTDMAQGISAQDAEKSAGVEVIAPMTQSEFFQVGDQLSEKYKAGKITWEEYSAMNDIVIQKKAQGASLAEVQAAVGLDPASLAKEQAVDNLQAELMDIYTQAAKEMQKKLDDYQDAYTVKLNKKMQDLQSGKITQDEYDTWVNNQLMHAKTMREKIDQLTGVTLAANQKAMAMINGEQLGVFAEGANYQAYQITKDANMDLMFSVYDERTVERLIKDKPELLPRKVVNGKKDVAWNQDKIAAAITQGVLQGESIKSLAARIAGATASTNMKSMMRYARTAMTAAQNSGRMEMLHQAAGMGIKAKKVWLATLDHRTRDAHAAMDGKAVGIDEKFPNGLMYPGDPNGPPGEVYNCRCTLIYEYEGMPYDPTLDQRRDQTTGEMIATMNYDEWKAAKQASKLNDLSIAKTHLAEVQKAFVKAKVSETKQYAGIWKDPVTLADYEAKKDSIQAKRDYYDSEITKYKDAQAQGKDWATDDKIKELEDNLKLLNEFDQHGKLLKKRNDAVAAIQGIYDAAGFQKAVQIPGYAEAAKKAAKKATKTAKTPADKTSPFTPDAYSKKRKDAALWTTDQEKVDRMMRGRTGEVWRKATAAEKDAIVEYTASFNKYNEPLRGIEYGTSAYKGVGKTDLNAGSKQNGKRLNAMTDIIDKCSYDHDMWLQRGCRFGGMDKFLGTTESMLRYGSEADLKKALLGKTVTEYGFMSMGSAKGKGFDCDILFNIYAPAGTKMMYAEPFSHYGGGDTDWDGKAKQSYYGGEFETIMQQGTQFRISKVEKSSRGIFIDIEVIGQDKQQRWTGKR